METWKPIKGYPNYEVSDLGRVRSLNWHNEGYTKCLYLKKHPRGYHQVELINQDGKKMLLVHRLVAEAFIPNPENKPQINHIDEDKQNNAVSNLEWCTRQQNMDAYFTNHPDKRRPLNERIKRPTKQQRLYPLRNKFLIGQFSMDGELIREWERARDIVIALNYNATSIWECCEGKRKKAYGYKWEYTSPIYINEKRISEITH